METPQLSTPSVEDALRREVANLAESFAGYRGRAEQAVEIIGRELLEEAERRGWCSEFDQFVERVNRLLENKGFELPVRNVTKTVEVEYIVTVRVTVDDADPRDDDATLEEAKRVIERGDFEFFHSGNRSADDVEVYSTEYRDGSVID